MARERHPEDSAGLIKIEPLSEEQSRVVALVIQNRAFTYAHAHNLSVIDKDDYKIALAICMSAFNRSLKGKSVPEKGVKKFAYEAVDSGLKKRANLIASGKRTVSKLKKYTRFQDEYPVPFYIDLAISKDLVEKAYGELQEPNVDKEIYFKNTHDLLSIMRKREVLLDILSDKILITTSGLDLDNPVDFRDYQYQKKLLATPHVKSMKIRGYLVAAILETIGSKSEYSSNYISQTALDDLINSASVLESINPSQKFVFVTSILMAAGVAQGEISIARDLVLDYFDQLVANLKNWERTAVVRTSTPKSDPDYWIKIREHFSAYPLDPIKLKDYFLTIDGIEKAEKEGSVHLWRNAIQVGDYWIPSPQDLIFAKNLIGRKGLEAFHNQIRIKRAIRAWYRYNSALKNPEKVSKDRAYLSELKQRLGIYKDTQENLPANLHALYANAQKLEQRLTMFKKAIYSNERALKFLSEFGDSQPDLEHSSVYIDIIKHQIDHEVAIFTGNQSVLLGYLLKHNLFTITYPEIDEVKLYNVGYCEELLQRAQDWLIELKANPRKRLPQSFENTETLKRLKERLEDITSRSKKSTSARADAARQAVRFFDDSTVINPMRKVFLNILESNMRTMEKFIMYSKRLNELLADQTAIYNLADKREGEYSQDLMDQLSGYFHEDRFREIRAGCLSAETQKKLNNLGQEIDKIKEFIDSAGKSSRSRYRFYTFPGKDTIDEFVTSKKLEISQKLSIEKKNSAKTARVQRTIHFLDELRQLTSNPFVDWESLVGLPFTSALNAIKQRVNVAMAILEKDALEAELKEIRSQLPTNITFSQLKDVVLRINATEIRIKQMENAHVNAQDILLAEMKKIGFAAPLTTLKR